MNNKLGINLENRETIVNGIREEIIGPVSDFSEAMRVDKGTTIEQVKKFNKNFRFSFFYHVYGAIKEEIVVETAPSRKYAAGLLYPQQEKSIEGIEDDDEELALMVHASDEEPKKIIDENLDDDTNYTRKEYQQSSMGFTFAVPYEANELYIEFSGGHYERFDSEQNIYNESLQNTKSDYVIPWWLRKSIKSRTAINLKRSKNLKAEKIEVTDFNSNYIEHFEVKLYSNIREINLRNGKPLKIVTITISNETIKGDDIDEKIIFQTQLKATLENNISFEQYPNASDMEAEISSEDIKFEMLYLNEKNYAFGHDCSTRWIEKNDAVTEITTTFIPEYEIKTMTPDIYTAGNLVEINHAKIAGANDYVELKEIFEPLILGYKTWVNKLSQTEIPQYYNESKKQNLEDINFAIKRIEKGIELLKDDKIRMVFQLVNIAMLMQMHNGKEIRKLTYNNEKGKINIESFNNYFEELDFDNEIKNLLVSIENTFISSSDKSIYKKSKWRGFQIAFLLQSLESIVNPKSDERDIVDLIWFPTGGGKTEAYLAVSAFSILYRRLNNPDDDGVDTIMRYTLRLLTADQFQRSSRLICSLEFIRKQYPSVFGDKEISIGLWVGSSTTPNQRDSANKMLLEFEKTGKNGFIVESCPWCGTEMKNIKDRDNKYRYMGYSHYKKELVISCPDDNCPFNKNLPVYFIDEQIYENPPTFLIGTIDKFVQLSWNPQARTLFGLDKEGNRIKSPPSLIIQDELHLISGPLGSLTGMYEPLIYDLCTDKRLKKEIVPKILSATATIKDSKKQIKDVFGKSKSKIFPPSGIDINDNYFSTILKDIESGKDAPGRKYVGIYTSTQGKLQTQVQTYTALITNTNKLQEEYKDPFYSILAFYNTINDIGKGITLIEQDIKNNIHNQYRSRGVTRGRKIRSGYVKELTSRKNSTEISRFISELKIPYSSKNNKAIDICLASNIIEVGIDIDRLSLMVINGQPKSTAQYIQVSGRVGRLPTEKPGLVVTIFNPQNSSDKSHFEHFIEYHQKLYAQVETSSVTPFSQFSIKRGLPAVIIAFIRQNFSIENIGSFPYREFFEDDYNFEKIRKFYETIRNKAKIIDDSELGFMDSEFERIIINLQNIQYDSWEYSESAAGFMAKIDENKEDIPENVQPVIFSMRNVDSQAQLIVKDTNYNRNIKKSRFSFD